MSKLQCSGCGAPLNLADGHREPYATCTYCGVQTPVPGAGPGRVEVKVHMGSHPQRSSGGSRVALIMIVASLVMFGVITAVVSSIISSTTDTVMQQVSSSTSGIPMPGAPNAATAWDRQSTLECGMGQHVRIEGSAELAAGPMVRASGPGCRIEIANAQLKVGAGTLIAVESQGARVTITGSTLEGDVIVRGGMANHVTVTNSQLTAKQTAIELTSIGGEIRVDGNSEVRGELAAVSAERSVRLELAAPAKLTSAGEALRPGAQARVTLQGGEIDGTRAGISAEDGLHLNVNGQAQIRSDGSAIVAENHANITLMDGTIKGKGDAIAVGDHARLELRGGRVEGGDNAVRMGNNGRGSTTGAEIVGERTLGRRTRLE